MRLEDWYRITLAEEALILDVAPPGGEPWQALIRWDQILRVCFEAADLWDSDTWYVFVQGRPESYPIPVEASGGSELLGAFLDRGLFDADLAIQAASATGQLFCWPPP